MFNTVAAPSANGNEISRSDKSRKDLDKNMDSFVKILVAQLKHQDPTEPLDASQFTQQLVQFSNVEQQINTNNYLEQLVNLQKGSSNINRDISYIGTIVEVNNSIAELTKDSSGYGEVNFSYSLPEECDTGNMKIIDSKGSIVFSTQLNKGRNLTAGNHIYTWNGNKQDGTKAADGEYSISIQAQKFQNGGKNIINVPVRTTTTGMVTQVLAKDNGKSSLVVNGREIDPKNILSITYPKSNNSNTENKSTNNPQVVHNEANQTLEESAIQQLMNNLVKE